MSELKPCPFCGSEAETVHLRSGDDFARCTNKSCHARTRNYHEAENLAVDAWNERVWSVAENDAEILGDVTQGLFRDLMAADPETAKL